MDGSFPEPASGTQKHLKRFLVSLLTTLVGIIKRLASLIHWTEEEQEEAGIYHGHLGGE